MAPEAAAEVQVFIGVLEDRALSLAALLAVEEDLLELRVDARPLSDHALDLDQLLQVNVPEVSQLVFNGQVLNSDKHLLEESLVLREDLVNELKGHLVKDGKDALWRLGDPNTECRHLRSDVGVVDI